MLLAYRQTARLLDHELFIGQRTDGTWQVWIEGRRPLQPESKLDSEEEAKKTAHSLAHRIIEEKDSCDCSKELRWRPLSQSGQVTYEERRAAKRVNYVCEIRCEDQGLSLFRIGRIANLSTDGAFIQTANPSLEGSILNLTFQIGRVTVQTQGEVIHRRPQYGMGIRFLDLQPGYKALIGDMADQGDQ